MVPLLVFLILLLSGCAGFVSQDEVRQLQSFQNQDFAPQRPLSTRQSQQALRSHQYTLKQLGRYENPRLQTYLELIGNKIEKISGDQRSVYQYTILDSEKIDAFIDSRTYVYITRGMLALINSEAELVAILSHEIAHSVAGHNEKRVRLMAQAAEQTDFIDQVRQFELEADALAIKYAAALNYDPSALSRILRRIEAFEQENFRKRILAGNSRKFILRTDNERSFHPNSLKRSNLIGKLNESISGDFIEGQSAYYQAIENLPYGPAQDGRHYVVKIITASSTDTFNRYAFKAEADFINPNYLRIINDYRAQQPPIVGTRLKIILPISEDVYR